VIHHKRGVEVYAEEEHRKTSILHHFNPVVTGGNTRNTMKKALAFQLLIR